MTKEEKLQKFTAHLVGDNGILSVILFGSYARGNSAFDSDIDLVVIVKEGYKRIAEHFDSQAFEIIYTTEQGAIEYWKNNMHDAVGLWSVAKILFDRDGTGRRLKTFGEKLCQELPAEVGKSTLDHLRFDFEDALRAIERIKDNDPATASLLLHKKISDLINLYFDLKRTWRPAPKQQLGQIQTQNAELWKILEDFYTAEKLSHKIATAEKIGIQVFG